MKNRDVAQAFVAGRPAASSNYHTDGSKLFSYATVIGWTDEAATGPDEKHGALRWERSTPLRGAPQPSSTLAG